MNNTLQIRPSVIFPVYLSFSPSSSLWRACLRVVRAVPAPVLLYAVLFRTLEQVFFFFIDIRDARENHSRFARHVKRHVRSVNPRCTDALINFRKTSRANKPPRRSRAKCVYAQYRGDKGQRGRETFPKSEGTLQIRSDGRAVLQIKRFSRHVVIKSEFF